LGDYEAMAKDLYVDWVDVQRTKTYHDGLPSCLKRYCDCLLMMAEAIVLG
jgi:hypothetical protein